MREELKNTKKLNNKGFSLIELIIVIAIMAVLIGIVGMQLMPYIQKSKEAKDKQVLSGILTNATSAFASCAESCEIPASGTQDMTISVTSGSFTKANIGGSFTGYDKVSVALGDLMNNSTTTFESKTGKKISTITISRDSTGKVTVSTNQADTFPAISST